jgi:hypothetical protein
MAAIEAKKTGIGRVVGPRAMTVTPAIRTASVVIMTRLRRQRSPTEVAMIVPMRTAIPCAASTSPSPAAPACRSRITSARMIGNIRFPIALNA